MQATLPELDSIPALFHEQASHPPNGHNKIHRFLSLQEPAIHSGIRQTDKREERTITLSTGSDLSVSFSDKTVDNSYLLSLPIIFAFGLHVFMLIVDM